MMSNFVFEELDKNRKKFIGLKKSDLMDDYFEYMLPWHDLFLKYLSEKEVELAIDEQETLKSVKAYLGLQLFGENTFNQIKNKNDVFLKSAIRTLDTPCAFDASPAASMQSDPATSTSIWSPIF